MAGGGGLGWAVVQEMAAAARLRWAMVQATATARGASPRRQRRFREGENERAATSIRRDLSRSGRKGNIPTEMRAFELDARDSFVGACPRLVHIFPQSSDGEYTPAGRNDLAILATCSRMEYLHIVEV